MDRTRSEEARGTGRWYFCALKHDDWGDIDGIIHSQAWQFWIFFLKTWHGPRSYRIDLNSRWPPGPGVRPRGCFQQHSISCLPARSTWMNEWMAWFFFSRSTRRASTFFFFLFYSSHFRSRRVSSRKFELMSNVFEWIRAQQFSITKRVTFVSN